MDLNQKIKILNQLYQDTDGIVISQEERRKQGLNSSQFTYGEIVFESFYQILTTVNPQSNDSFCDLGSGIGKAVLSASLFFNFKKSLGIELLEELYQVAKQKLSQLKNILTPYNLGQVNFLHDDFLKVDLKDYDIIFSHATCFSQDLINSLQNHLSVLKKDSRVILVTKTFENENIFALYNRSTFRFTWGEGTVNFYYKK